MMSHNIRFYLLGKRFCSNVLSLIKRYKSVEVSEHLRDKSLLHIFGSDSTEFLQGIITNDMACLHRPICHNAIYAMILNNQGRILHDIMLYNRPPHQSTPSYWLECETTARDEIVKLFKLYRIRRKVVVEPLTSHNVWAIWSEDPNNLYVNNTIDKDQESVLVPDPRLLDIGMRFVTSNTSHKLVSNIEVAEPGSYRSHLYNLGVGEGEVDMPPSKSFPLESNADWLHGVSFTKGCYVGQELTARTHFTGVIRKRLMPIKFERPVSRDDLRNVSSPDDITITNDDGKKVGKFRGVADEIGLALLRYEQCVDQKLRVDINGAAYRATTSIPKWWNLETNSTAISSGFSQ